MTGGCSAGSIRPTRAVRVKNYVERIRYDVGVIAHSCGVPHLRALKRFHCRIVQDTGKSVLLDELYPPAIAEREEKLTEPA